MLIMAEPLIGQLCSRDFSMVFVTRVQVRK